MEGGKFVLIAAKNLVPCTPVEHVRAFYGAAKEFGRYGGQGNRTKWVIADEVS